MSDADKEILGAIIAALIGAIVGAFGVFMVGEHTRKKQIEQDEISYNRQKLKANYASVSEAEDLLHNYLYTA